MASPAAIILVAVAVVAFDPAAACNFLAQDPAGVAGNGDVGETMLHSNHEQTDCAMFFPASEGKILNVLLAFERAENVSER